MAVLTIRTDFVALENKLAIVSPFSSSICHEVMGQEAVVLVFWMLSFKSTFRHICITKPLCCTVETNITLFLIFIRVYLLYNVIQATKLQ